MASHLAAALEAAAWWGAELDPRYRVLALTLEPGERSALRSNQDDPRLQLLCHPVSTILATLRRDEPDPAILAFHEAQLLEVVASFGGAPLEEIVVGGPEPRPGEWGPSFSLEGRSHAPDGTAHTLRVRMRDDGLSLALFARFDTLELRDAEGREVVPPS